MNKKILIGSIIALCILIGVSFTSVVGYRSVDSDVKASPLFNIRCSRAIDEEDEGFRCEYVGKNEENTIWLPNRDNKIELVQNFIDRLSKINDKSLDNFIDKSIIKLYHNEGFRNLNVNLITNSLKQLINNPEEVRNYEDNNFDIETIPKNGYLTTGDFWYPGCSIIFLLFYIYIFFGMVFLIVLCKFADPPTFDYSWYAHN